LHIKIAETGIAIHSGQMKKLNSRRNLRQSRPLSPKTKTFLGAARGGKPLTSKMLQSVLT